MSLNGDKVRFHKPVVYQEVDASWSATARSGHRLVSTTAIFRRPLRSEAENQVTFRVGAYDRTKPLIIDPVLTYSSYLGGSSPDEGHAIAIDASGNAYVTGPTVSLDFPRVNQASGACEGSCGQGPYTDVFVTKINASGTALVYSSYLGGSGGDIGYGIAVDGSNKSM